MLLSACLTTRHEIIENALVSPHYLGQLDTIGSPETANTATDSFLFSRRFVMVDSVFVTDSISYTIKNSKDTIETIKTELSRIKNNFIIDSVLVYHSVVPTVDPNEERLVEYENKLKRVQDINDEIGRVANLQRKIDAIGTSTENSARSQMMNLYKQELNSITLTLKNYLAMVQTKDPKDFGRFGSFEAEMKNLSERFEIIEQAATSSHLHGTFSFNTLYKPGYWKIQHLKSTHVHTIVEMARNVDNYVKEITSQYPNRIIVAECIIHGYADPTNFDNSNTWYKNQLAPNWQQATRGYSPLQLRNYLNKVLSERRARALSEFMRSSLTTNVDENIVGYGETLPKNVGATVEEYPDRRVCHVQVRIKVLE